MRGTRWVQEELMEPSHTCDDMTGKLRASINKQQHAGDKKRAIRYQAGVFGKGLNETPERMAATAWTYPARRGSGQWSWTRRAYPQTRNFRKVCVLAGRRAKFLPPGPPASLPPAASTFVVVRRAGQEARGFTGRRQAGEERDVHIRLGISK